MDLYKVLYKGQAKGQAKTRPGTRSSGERAVLALHDWDLERFQTKSLKKNGGTREKIQKKEFEVKEDPNKLGLRDESKLGLLVRC